MNAAEGDEAPVAARDLDRRVAWGCLGIVVALALVAGSAAAWLSNRFAIPEPIPLATSAQSLCPWPAPLAVVVEFKVLGLPDVSNDFAPKVEELYVLLRADGLDAGEVSARAAEHLSRRGWSMKPAAATSMPAPWYAFDGQSSRPVDWAYVGSLSDYLESHAWVAGETDPPAVLRRSAGKRVSQLAVVFLRA